MKTLFRFRSRSRRRLLALVVSIAAALGLALGPAMPAAFGTAYTTLSGEGSTWAGNAVNQWTVDLKSQGNTVNFNANGSSTGRKDFAIGLAHFAVSEIPFKGDTADPQDVYFPKFGYAMLPVAAGGTSFMYNLPVGGKRYTDLKLSQDTLAGIFTGTITRWNDPALKATNPGVNLPDQQIRVVVRSEGSGATAQFTMWLKRQFPARYQQLCAKAQSCPGGNGPTSYFPSQNLGNFSTQSGSNGVTTYTANTPYTINYDEYSYALNAGFPVVRVGNAAGFFTIPTDTAVAVALTRAQINTDKNSANYLAQDLSNVYAYKDPRAYPLSAYTYLIGPTQTHDSFDNAKGAALGNFTAYSLCEGQQTMGQLGYSPLPMNLVLAAMDQVRRFPGVDAETRGRMDNTTKSVAAGQGNPCNNPTFKPGDSINNNQLVATAPFPDGCDASCQAPWTGKQAGINGGPGAAPGQKGGVDAPANTPLAGGAAGGPNPAAGPGGVPNANTPGAKAGSKPGTVNGKKTPTGTGAGAAKAKTGVVPGSNPEDAAAADQSGDVAAAAGPGAKAAPVVLAGNVGWGTQQNLLVVVVGLLLVLVLVPALAQRFFGRGRSGGGS